MRSSKVIHVVSCHAQGEVGNVIAGGVQPRPGESLWEQARRIDPGKLDRSPYGTGCSARMAVLHARGQMQVGDRLIDRSIIDSRFDCSIVEETRVGERRAIKPSIRVRAWISGTHQLMLDPEDPWPEGYRVSDTWPVKPT